MKVFGYPKFDENGQQILTTYDNEYKAMLMDIRVFRLHRGEEKAFGTDGEETAVLLLSGKITYKWDGRSEKASRKDVFSEGPYCLHIYDGGSASVLAEADSEILVRRPSSTVPRMPRGNTLAAASSATLLTAALTRYSTTKSRRNRTWCSARCSTTQATGRDICLTAIRSRKRIISNSTVPKVSAPASWATKCLRAWTAVSPPFRAAGCIRSLRLPALSCTHAG